MSAANSLVFPTSGRKPGPDLHVVRMITGIKNEDDLFLKFLSRGFACSTNRVVHKMIMQFGYYSVFIPNWSRFEKSLTFGCLSYELKLDPSGQIIVPEGECPSPTIKIQIVGNRIFCPNEFWGEERDWLLGVHQPVNIFEIVRGWLHDWGIKVSVESSTPIGNTAEIDREARKLRIPMYAKPEGQKDCEYQKTLKLMARKQIVWDKLIEKAKKRLVIPQLRKH